MTKANRARPRRKLQSAKQLRVCSHNNSGQAHGDCTDTNGEIESAVDEKNRERERYAVVYGAKLKVNEGDQVKLGDVPANKTGNARPGQIGFGSRKQLDR